MFILQLNDMRSPNAETLTPVARAETREGLEAFLKRENVAPYYEGDQVEGRWFKVFYKGGPLEWYNPPRNSKEYFVDMSTREDWIARACQQFNDVLCEVPAVSSL